MNQERPTAAAPESGIFISYRRDDSAGHTGRLFDRLSRHFGADKVFMDIDTIEPGEDFAEAIKRAVAACDVLIAVIGRDWSSSSDEGGRRLERPNDYVRVEVAAALERNIRVIPVLVEKARMPIPQELPEALQALSFRNALELSDTRWDYDVGRLITALEKVLARSQTERTATVAGVTPVSSPRPDTPSRPPEPPDSEVKLKAANDQISATAPRFALSAPSSESRFNSTLLIIAGAGLATAITLTLLILSWGSKPGGGKELPAGSSPELATPLPIATTPPVAANAPASPPLGPTRAPTITQPTAKPTASQLAAKPTATQPAKTLKVSSGVLAESAIVKVQPTYPPIAKAAGAAGAVQVLVTISEQGQVIDAAAVSGHPLLRDAALQAARQWKFNPTLLSGGPVKVQGMLTFNFTLQ